MILKRARNFRIRSESQDLTLIDGTHGGGQVLRTALSLSIIPGRPFRMTGIRGKRSRP
ncbi:RNA 3'-terminal phosphate cyclase [Pseudomonas sp. T1.Ur]|uniref:RNA 3'-terminal phosphate cyclase n=1 Tax=Pseudomonas sp. T1.Ur TaxID=2928704 RepID=UPI0032E3B464